MKSIKFVIQKYELQFDNMMLMRAMIRVKTLPTCVNGHLTKNLNTNAATDAAASSESKPKHLKLSTDESVSLLFL